MFTHVMVGSNDLERSKAFYDALFAAVGGNPANVDGRGRLTYQHNGGVFMVTQPLNGEPASGANGGTIGFAVDSAEQGHAWHDAGVANGGTSVEDTPGVRDFGRAQVFLAYLRDPDGNKICAMKVL